MKLVDTLVCVVCGKREYSAAKGKSARVQNAVCDDHGGDITKHSLIVGGRDATQNANGSQEQQTGIPEGKPRK